MAMATLIPVEESDGLDLGGFMPGLRNPIGGLLSDVR